MVFSILIPLCIGALGVLQNTINKKAAMSLGVPVAIAVNGVVLGVAALLFLFVVRFVPESSLPDLFRPKAGLETLGWRHLIPGIFGFLIIITAPSAIERVGATRVFIGIIVAQIAVSILWDYYAESLPIPPLRILGAVLALAGALLAAR